MRLYLITIFLLSVFFNAQSINISVAMPQDCNLENEAKLMLKNKLQNIISYQGVAGTECGALIITPEVNIIRSNIIHGGMRQINSVELCITFTVRNIITNTVFNSIQTTLSGEGYSMIEANRSAINKIETSSPFYQKFIDSTGKRILDYYETNTSAIIEKANTLASQQLFDKAFALLATYPENLPSYNKVANTISSIFKKYQTQQCSQLLLSAQAAFSRKDYELATELVSLIDAQSDCVSDAQELLKSITQNLDKQYDDLLKLEAEKMQSHERIELAKTKAISDIASAYIRNQTEYIFFW